MANPGARSPKFPSNAQLVSAFLACILGLGVSACGRGAFRQFEYEEEIFLSLDGSATVYVNASIPSLVALRGFDLDTNPAARLDKAMIKRLYTSPVAHVVRISSSRRHLRRFVHIRLEVSDVRQLARAAPFAWSSYRFARSGQLYVYRQTVGASANRPVGSVGWDGSEQTSFRLHLPSRITYHNAGAGNLLRGNILVWEQSLADRRAGVPLELEARMETTSILYRTLWLFGISMLAALGAVALAVWWVIRRAPEAEVSSKQ